MLQYINLFLLKVPAKLDADRSGDFDISIIMDIQQLKKKESKALQNSLVCIIL